jgi:predicted ribosomally synthesized peptide with SipW-like signal peptide
MLNKKLILSLLTVGMLATVATAGTWAYFQDTITSTGNGVTTATVIMDINGRTSTSGTQTISGVAPNVIPGVTTPQTIVANLITNKGSIPVDVFAKLDSSTINADMKIFVDSKEINSATYTKINTGAVVKDGTLNGDIKFTYADNGLQNTQEGQPNTFNVKYVMVPTGKTPV